VRFACCDPLLAVVALSGGHGAIVRCG
jgi:hypothetical protein